MGPQILISAILAIITKSGRRAVSAPVLAYRAFAGLESLHWAEWLSLVYVTMISWDILFFWAGPRDPLGPSVLSATTWNLFAIWVVSGLGLFLKGFCERASAFGPLAFLNWHPGNKRLRLMLLGRASARAPAPLFTGSDSGAAKGDERLLRGAAIADGGQLGYNIRAANPPGALDLNITWGGVPVSVKNEPLHFLIEGSTGTGKSQAINEVLRKVRQRRQPAIIADPGGGYLARFGTGNDLVLNPFDARSLRWSPFNDIEQDYDCLRIAKAIIPDGAGDSKEWNQFAQTLLSEILRAMYRRKDTSLKALLYYATAATAEELQNLLAGSAAAPYVAHNNERMLASIRATGSTFLLALSHIPDGGTFSIRQWVRSTDQSPSWLYLTYRDDQMGLLRNLVSCWLELAIIEALSLSESHDRRLWFIMDELDSLGKVVSLRDGLTKLRKFGGVCLGAVQTVAQLRDTYGHDGAQILLSNMSNKLILRTGDAETAKYFEQLIGQQEVERVEFSENQSSSTSMQGGSSGSGTTASRRRLTQSAVLAAELMNLPDMHGYLMLPPMPLARIGLELVKMEPVQPAFVRNEVEAAE